MIFFYRLLLPDCSLAQIPLVFTVDILCTQCMLLAQFPLSPILCSSHQYEDYVLLQRVQEGSLV